MTPSSTRPPADPRVRTFAEALAELLAAELLEDVLEKTKAPVPNAGGTGAEVRDDDERVAAYT